MKFDVLIGNPPYNNDLYIKFCDLFPQLISPSGASVLIVPAKWQSKSSPDNTYFRENIIAHTSCIKYYPVAREIFPTIKLHGGISVLLSTTSIHNNKQILCMRDNSEYLSRYGKVVYPLDSSDIEISIIHKVRSLHEPLYVNDINCEIQRVNSIKHRYNTENQLSSNTNEDILQKIQQQGSGCYFVDAKHRVEISPSCISDSYSTYTYRLIHSSWKEDTSHFGILNPYEVTNNAYVYLYKSEKLSEVQSVLSYLETNLIWFLIHRCHHGAKLNAATFEFIPACPDKTILYTNKLLYAKYGITAREIAYLESVVQTQGPGKLGLRPQLTM